MGIYSFTLPKCPPQKLIATDASLGEKLGLNAFKLFGITEETQNFNEQNELRINGKSGMYETQIRIKNNEIKWIIISGAPIYNNENEVIGSIGIHVDITSRKKLEKETY